MFKERAKRVIAMLLAVLMCLSTDALPVLASQTENSIEITQTVDVKEAGQEVVVEAAAEEENQEEEETYVVETASWEEEMEVENPNAIPSDFVDDSDVVLQQLMEQAEDIVMTSAANGSKKADVVFVIDYSGSMSSYISSVKTNLAAFVNYLAQKGITLRFGIIDYEDITCDGMDSTRVYRADSAGSTWYTSASDTIAAIGSIRVDNGGDWEETVIDALGYLVDDETYNWSGNATRCAIVLTDADFKYNSRWGYTENDEMAMKEVAKDLKDRNIVTSVITEESCYEYYQELVDTTGGVLGNIRGDYLATLVEMADNILKFAAVNKIGVYVLPGYMGSQLYLKDDSSTEKVENEKVWVELPKLEDIVDSEKLLENPLIKDVYDYVEASLAGEKEEFSVNSIIGRDTEGENPKVEVNPDEDKYGTFDTYKNLVDRLNEELDSKEFTVEFFPYDWLGDLNDSTIKLEEHIRGRGYDKVIFVTHSTGGLLASSYIAKSELNRDKVDKAILVAPPLYGTYTALEPLEQGITRNLSSKIDIAKMLVDPLGIKLGDDLLIATLYGWVKNVVKNTPTTYQLLPSLEYLKFMPQEYSIDIKSPVTNMEDYYNVLKNRKGNLNANLLDGNDNSHQYFRETVLGGDIRNVLNQVDTTVIGNSYGYDTPAIAVSSKSFIGKLREHKEIIYKKDGDGTVMGVSALLRELPGTVADGIQRIDMRSKDDSNKLDHTGLVTEKEGIDTILACIQEDEVSASAIDWAEDEVYTVETASSEGMSDAVKMMIYNNQATEIKITNSDGHIVASAFEKEITGFGETEGFIYDVIEDGTVSDSGITEYLYQIYVPNAGYKVELYNTTENAPDLMVSVATLDRDGYRKNTATYSATTATEGLIVSFDLTQKVTDESVSALETEADYVGIMSSYNDWSIEDSAFIDKIGNSVTLELFGSDADKVNVKNDIVWTSSDTGVVTVKDNVVTAVGYGTATIYAANKDGNGKVETCEVKVGKYPEKITIDDFTLIKGHRIQPKVTFEPADVNMTDMTYVSNDEQVVKVLNESTLWAVSEGTARITGTTVNGLTAEFYVTVTASDTLYVDEVSIDPMVAVLSEDKKTEVVARIVPETALNKTVFWGIVDESIASLTVNEDNSCTLTGLKEGVTKLTVLSDDGSYSDESTIVVGSILDITKSNRMIMQPMQSKQIVLGKSGVYYPVVKASTTNEKVATVTETGMINAVAPGTVILSLEGNLKGEKVTTNLQIEVVNTLRDVVEEVKIETKTVKSNIYKKVAGSVVVDIQLEDSALSAFAVEEANEDINSVAMAITKARFADETVNSLFKLSPTSDNVLNINPNMSLEKEAVKSLAKTYSSKIVVTVGGKDYTSTNAVTIEIDKKAPVIKTKAVTLNTFFADASAEIPFTTDCGKVTEVKINSMVENALPQGIELEPQTQKVKYAGGTIKAGNTVKLLVKTDEIRDFMAVNLNVKAKKTKPKFKLSKSTINVFKDIEYAKGQELTLKTSDKKTLEDYKVASLALADVSELSAKELKTYKINNEYKITDFNVEDGTFTIKANSSDGIAKAGKLLLKVKMYGTTEMISVPLSVKVSANPKLTLKNKSLTMNSRFRYGVTKTVDFTISPADYDTKDLRVVVTDKNGVESSDITAKLRGNSVVITTTYNAENKEVFYVKLMDGIINTSLKVTMKNQKASANITCTGNIDIADESKSAKLKVSLKGITANASGITIYPTITYRYKNGRKYSNRYVSDAFDVISMGDGTFKITLNKDSSSYKSGYISPSYSYKIEVSVNINDNYVGNTSKKKLSVKLNKQTMNLNHSQIDLTETNVKLPVALVGTLSKMPSEEAQWEISGKAMDFCDVINLGNGKYSITMNPVMTKRDASGTLILKAYLPGKTKVIAQKSIKVTFKK